MIKTAVTESTTTEKWVIPAIQVISASILLALVSQISIPLPFSPVPLSLQTLGIFLIALTLGSKKGTAAVLTYLAQGTMGLPVFAGGLINPLWYMGPRAGYLVGFAIAAWLIGRLCEQKKERSLIQTILILTMGEAAILIPGVVWLSLFVGMPNAVGLGAVPFLPGDFIKIIVSATSLPFLNRGINKLF